MKKLSLQSFNVSSAITIIPTVIPITRSPRMCLSLVIMVLECVFFVRFFGHGMCISLVSLVHQITNTRYTRYICNLNGSFLFLDFPTLFLFLDCFGYQGLYKTMRGNWMCWPKMFSTLYFFVRWRTCWSSMVHARTTIFTMEKMGLSK